MQINAPSLIERSLESPETGASCLVEKDCFALCQPGSSVESSKRANISSNTSKSSMNQEESLLWVDDYQCSRCGFELPPSFIEERQEHFDFHLAERLQEEESGNNPMDLLRKQRYYISPCLKDGFQKFLQS